MPVWIGYSFRVMNDPGRADAKRYNVSVNPGRISNAPSRLVSRLNGTCSTST
jgi:hypothetical protein